ncbi:hypothetical protein ACHAW5_001213 [Stephanodiscus triporus]|uniref:Uncharacterized protein n=1 Tax=Stephanodiscus triporus TaxID=2934178 RepID=A0ABD3N4A9_9STRA
MADDPRSRQRTSPSLSSSSSPPPPPPSNHHAAVVAVVDRPIPMPIHSASSR